MPRSALTLPILASLSLAAFPARAGPQLNAALLTGVCGRGDAGQLWRETCWHNGLRGDAIFGRTSPRDLGAGPYLAAETAGFDDLRLGTGATVHLPTHRLFPLLVSAGPYVRVGGGGSEPGASARIFLGSRSYNYHGPYALAFGLVGGVDVGLGGARERTFVIAAQVDALVLALPFLLAYEALRGSPAE